MGAISGEKVTIGASEESASAEWLPLPDSLDEHPPSWKLIYAMLHEMEGMSGKEIYMRGSMSPGTVYPALKQMEDYGLIDRHEQFGSDEVRWTIAEE